jgi:hypothetical protein
MPGAVAIEPAADARAAVPSAEHARQSPPRSASQRKRLRLRWRTANGRGWPPDQELFGALTSASAWNMYPMPGRVMIIFGLPGSASIF